MASEPITSLDFLAHDGRRHPGRRMTEAQFEAWLDEDTRAEWVDGEIVMMAPADYTHSRLDLFLLAILQAVCEDSDLGVALGPEFTVRLARQRRRRVPDVLFVARSRMAIVKDTYVDGAPDLIMEIVSADSAARDWRDKYLDYQAAGVREYWVIDALSQRVEAYALKDKAYQLIPERRGVLASRVVRGFWIKTAWLWKRPLPSIVSVLKELKVID